MSEVKHSLGPWHVDAMGNIWAADTKICDMSTQPKQNQSYRQKSSEEHEANRNIMAAAPELLEACERLIESLHVMVTDGDNDPDIVFARDILKKAGVKV